MSYHNVTCDRFLPKDIQVDLRPAALEEVKVGHRSVILPVKIGEPIRDGAGRNLRVITFVTGTGTYNLTALQSWKVYRQKNKPHTLQECHIYDTNPGEWVLLPVEIGRPSAKGDFRNVHVEGNSLLPNTRYFKLPVGTRGVEVNGADGCDWRKVRMTGCLRLEDLHQVTDRLFRSDIPIQSTTCDTWPLPK